MMIIYNWPDRCPNCKSEEAVNPVQLDPSQVEDVPEGCQAFVCGKCEAVWAEQLIRSDKHPCFVAVAEPFWHAPVGILAPNATVAKKMFHLMEQKNYVVSRLEKILDDGEARVQFVTKALEAGNPALAVGQWLPVDEEGNEPRKSSIIYTP